MYRALKHTSERVAKAALIQRPGEDLIMQVYMAGLFHGMTLATER